MAACGSLLLPPPSLGYHGVDLESGRVLNVHVPKPLPKTGILPLNFLHHKGNRLLMHDSALEEREEMVFRNRRLPSSTPAKGVVIDEYGDMTKDLDLSWDSMPSAVGASQTPFFITAGPLITSLPSPCLPSAGGAKSAAGLGQKAD